MLPVKKEQILMSMNVLELFKAMSAFKKSEHRVQKAFTVAQKECSFRYTEEMIGFEGVSMVLCNNAKHPNIKSMYPSCCAKDCPSAN